MATYAEGQPGHRGVHSNLDTSIETLQSNMTTALAKNEGLNPRGLWAAGVSYRANDLVDAGTHLFRVKVGHVSGSTAPTLATPGANYEVFATPDGNLAGSIMRRDSSANVLANKFYAIQETPDSDSCLTTRGFVLDAINIVPTISATASFSLAIGNLGQIVEQTSASATTVTVPAAATVAFPVGSVIQLRQYGAGQLTVAPATGVTIRSRGGALKLAGQYAEASLIKRGTNEWILSGDIVV